MTTDSPAAGTAKVNGSFWGSSARDWASIQEGQFKAGYEAVLAHCGVGPETVYLDAGCGAGMATQIASSRGARVSGFDAAEALLAIARERVPAGDFRVADLEAYHSATTASMSLPVSIPSSSPAIRFVRLQKHGAWPSRVERWWS